MNGPFPMMPFPMMVPWNQHQQAPHPDQQVPPRVRVAMELLSALTVKTMARAAVNEMGIEVIPGQKLNNAESNAQAEACSLLTDYFRGKAKPDWWERKAHEDVMMPKGTLVTCFHCVGTKGGPKSDCILCKGSGEVLVTPMSGGG